MDKYDFVVVNSGSVSLAIACKLAKELLDSSISVIDDSQHV